MASRHSAGKRSSEPHRAPPRQNIRHPVDQLALRGCGMPMHSIRTLRTPHLARTRKTLMATASLVCLVFSASPALASGPGVGGIPTTNGSEDREDPSVSAHRATIDTQSRSRAALDTLTRVWEQHDIRLAAAEEALDRCQGRSTGACHVEERNLESARIDGGEAKQLAAMEAYGKLDALQSELRIELAARVVLEPRAFTRIQHRSYVEGEDQLGEFVSVLDSLDHMLGDLNELVRDITAGEIERQQDQLRTLMERQNSMTNSSYSPTYRGSANTSHHPQI